jgi:hypothetical protein
MKLWKHTLISAFAFFGVAGTVLYTSCEKDTCEGLNCQNGGSCTEGFCRCNTGYEGTECEIKAGTKFIGRFIGNYTCPSVTPLKDTVEIWFDQEPDKLKFVQYSKKSDTLTGTAAPADPTKAIKEATTIQFGEQVNGNYRKYTSAVLQGQKLSIYLDEVFNMSTGEKKTCQFIGFR